MGKNIQVDHDVETYTVGRDREMDLYLARYDVLGSIAHITMLQTINLLTAGELSQLTAALREIYAEIEAGKFVMEDGIEDVHSQVELMLTRRLGDVGKKSTLVARATTKCSWTFASLSAARLKMWCITSPRFSTRFRRRASVIRMC